MAELRPYEPSWRDRLAQKLLGTDTARPSQARQRFVQGLVGSDGLGGSYANVADATPFGMAFGLNEYARAKTPGEAFAAAAAFIPAAKPVAGAAKVGSNALADAIEQALTKPAATAAPAITEGIRAYHGSPHSFDKFSMSKIGTGEGAQAYGHGLYFAENEGVAKGYRDQLSPLKISGWPTGNTLLDREIGIDGLPAEAINRLSGRTSDEEAKAAAEFGKKLLSSGKLNVEPSGSMYEVRIKASPDDFLDWDKPLSDQGQKARDAVNRVARSPEPYGLDKVTDDMRGIEMKRLLNDPQGVSALKEAGVPGIKYLDAGSRGVGDGSRNYVVFDESLIEIMRKYGLIPAGVGLGAYDYNRKQQAGQQGGIIWRARGKRATIKPSAPPCE